LGNLTPGQCRDDPPSTDAEDRGLAIEAAGQKLAIGAERHRTANPSVLHDKEGRLGLLARKWSRLAQMRCQDCDDSQRGQKN
jgi:hypothetical protein